MREGDGRGRWGGGKGGRWGRCGEDSMCGYVKQSDGGREGVFCAAVCVN